MFGTPKRKRLLGKYQNSDKELDKINQAREAVGLKPIVKEIRECLKCNKKFEAYKANANFMCDSCRGYHSDDTIEY